MSKARLVITAVVAEGRSQGEVARADGVSQGWVSRLVARYRAESEAAFEPRPRQPRISPLATRDSVTPALQLQVQQQILTELAATVTAQRDETEVPRPERSAER
jgi:transposase